jgi:hypothetical protein
MDHMSNLRVRWMYGGSILLVLISSLIMTVGYMSTLVPMPIYQVILAWVISTLYIFVVPSVYFIEMQLLSQSKHFIKIVPVLIIIFSLLSILYFWSSWNYGYQYQGEFHTNIVAIENFIGFSFTLAISLWALKNKNTAAAYLANFLLFALLSWCAFPYLGELL